jgi:aminoglycoside phosphotransferase (APT) family kinase protein
MARIQEKWRESLIDINSINFENVELEKIISYPPAGNDVFECIGKFHNKQLNFIVKSERGKFADFSNEIKILPIVSKNFPVPKILESGKINGLTYIVLSKIDGDKLSDIFKGKTDIDKKKYLFIYGQTLAKIHKLKINWSSAKIRDINTYPNANSLVYKNLDEWESKLIEMLKKLKPKKMNLNTFIHGDFHYGNILWDDYKIMGILDWEYSGMGFKEQDIAWALILRPGQQFMNNKHDIEDFLKGYNSVNTYDDKNLYWCLINGMLHFYLINKSGDSEYLMTLKKQINELLNAGNIDNY